MLGRYETQRKIQELKELSENDFFAIDIQADDLFDEKCHEPAPAPEKAAGGR